MPLFGAHMSIAGGLHNAVAASVAHGCETVQIFTKNQKSWDCSPLAEDDVRAFRQAAVKARLRHTAAHDSYLINLASPHDEAFQKSIDAFTVEVERAEALGLSYLVSHPGAHLGRGEEAGLARLITGMNEVRKRCAGVRVKVLLETTTGSGTCLGGKFEHLRTILDGVRDASWLGVCLDTCHVFAAGYPIGTPEDYATTFGKFDDVVGLARLKLFHVNDSEGEFGSRVDRHAGIGLGKIGREAFRMLVTDPRFRNRPMVLETPKESEAGDPMDAPNLAVLRGFLAGDATASAG